MKNKYYDNLKRRKSWVYPDESLTSTAKLNIYAKKVLYIVGSKECYLLSTAQIWWNCLNVIGTNWLDWVTYLRKKDLLSVLEKEKLFWFMTICRKRKLENHLRYRLENFLSRSVFFNLALQITMFSDHLHHLIDSHFKSPKEIDKSINEFINSKPPSFFWNGFHQLSERWKKCKKL